MKLNFKNVYVISETVIRKNLESSFWPEEYRTYRRQALIDQNKREGWYCDFENHGLRLQVKIIISENDYRDWPPDHRTNNLNTIRSDLQLHDEFSIELNNIQLQIVHSPQIAEEIRKKIYLSNHFKERSDSIWAAQYFELGQRDQMHFAIGFKREMLQEDALNIDEIKKIALSVQGVKLL